MATLTWIMPSVISATTRARGTGARVTWSPASRCQSYTCTWVVRRRLQTALACPTQVQPGHTQVPPQHTQVLPCPTQVRPCPTRYRACPTRAPCPTPTCGGTPALGCPACRPGTVEAVSPPTCSRPPCPPQSALHLPQQILQSLQL